MISNKVFRDLGIEPPKTAAQLRQEAIEQAKALPLEVKKAFWKAMTEDRKNVGEAREIAGIDDVMVAAQLVIMFHKEIYLPIEVDEIK